MDSELDSDADAGQITVDVGRMSKKGGNPKYDRFTLVSETSGCSSDSYKGSLRKGVGHSWARCRTCQR